MLGRCCGLLLLLALCAVQCVEQAQARLPETPRFRRFGQEQGLPKSVVAAELDHQGYLWMATEDGLARYDGVEFTLWRHVIGLSGSLPDNMLEDLYIDSGDRIWVASRDGLSWLGADRKEFERISFDGANANCSDNVTFLTGTPDGTIWTATSDGLLCRIAPDGRSVERFVPGAGAAARLPRGPVTALMADPRGRLLVGTANGLARYDQGRFERIGRDETAGLGVGELSQEADGSIWVGTSGGLFRLSADDRMTRPPWKLGEDAGNAIVISDLSGGRWIGTTAGLYRVDADDNVRLLQDDAGDGLWDYRSGVLQMLRDEEGGIWLVTYSQGLVYLPPDWNRFASVTSVGGRQIDRLDARDVAPDGDGGFWMLTATDLYRLRAGSGTLEPVASSRELGLKWMHTLYARPDGRLWIGHSGGLVLFDPASGQGRSWPLDPKRPRLQGTVWFLHEQPDGGLWIWLSDGSVHRYSADGEELAPGPIERTLATAGFLTSPGTFRPGPDGQLWFAGGTGLHRWDGDGFVAVPGGEFGDIQAMTFAGPQRLWLARTGALEAYRWKDGKLSLERRIDNTNDYPDTNVSGLLASRNGTVWATTARGLLMVSPDARRLRLFGLGDGIPNVELTRTTPHRNADGIAAALSLDGMVLFDLDTPFPNARPPRLSLESLSVRREEDDWALSPAGGGVQLESDDRDFRVVARLMSFLDPRSHIYRFKLEGYDPDWIEQRANGERVFSRLDPGEYRLLVKAAGADGIWSEPVAFELWVKPPWWRSTWAQLVFTVLGIVLIGIVAVAYRRRLGRRSAWQLAVHKREVAEQASLAKTRFLATLGHEVRTPMTGVLGMSELLLDTPLDEKQRGYTESIKRAGEHLLRLVNDALDLARIESGRLELQDRPFDLHALVEEAAGLMQPLARQRGLAFEVEIADDAPPGLRGDPHRVSQILMNLLGNAIKFTEHGRVGLRVRALSPQGVRFEVSDTGPGLNDEQKARLFRRFEQAEGARTAARYGGSGLGLAICQELAAAMDGQVSVVSQAGQGARFVLDLPLPAAAPPSPSQPRDRYSPRVPVAPERSVPRAILLVEDDATVAEVIAGLLRAQGHRVTHVANGLAALAETATARFDLALLDLDLPGINGLDLARQLRVQGFAQPLVAVTARADADAEPQARRAGFDLFLRKPVTGAMLAEAIERVVDAADAP
ncbi:histidine kinase-, DNA gyrase B-, and HSP90-like ATPase [Lysobacter enzymogenes]|uniref:histidine kinase n=1 Tax=Lysobacter enzymogenes TaxID=69 RepID=A0A0S2DDC6_LYSEN|nr:ATP-binding protein [Lysobacter enzymogenes]ALN56501.1 histidine kinase-, DNA gyrase B-, and HSP90-like ATPase [Lysobacter enzymogenes]QCW25320.1 response regulator [Lysobacter enzymogenes]